MLSELKLSNFRIFDDEALVRFRPITVLIGRNSSGKSTIIKFLLMMKQSSMSSALHFPTVEGKEVNMGTFGQLKNSKTRKSSLRFEVAFRGPFVSTDFVSRFLQQDREVEESSLVMKVHGQVPYSGTSSDGKVQFSLGPSDSKVSHTRISTSLEEDVAFSLENLVITMEEIQDGMQQVKKLGESDRELAKQIRQSLAVFFQKAAASFELSGQLSASSHLPPVRQELHGVVDTSSHLPKDSVGRQGQYTVAHLLRLDSEDSQTFQFLLPYLRNVAGLESVKFETISEDSLRALAKNRETGANVLISDYGFGVSQCLPVLVQGALMAPNSILIVEQPEAQLHPTAQLELGSFFSDLWTKRRVGSIIETHSSNVLLRIRRLVARGDLSHQDVSVAYFTSNEEKKGQVPMVKNLDIYEDGSMEEGLPMEFFAADIEEAIYLGARA